MNDHFSPTEEKIKSAGNALTLSATEKIAGRDALRAYLRAHPARSATSPLVSFLTHGLRSAFALVLIVLVGAGVTSAAESSRPGNILYSLKVHVSEPVRAAFTTQPEARAEFETERASRRLSEYAHASVAKSADQDLDQELARSLVAHVGDARDAIADLAEAGNAMEAHAAAADLQMILGAHAIVLERIREDMATSSEERAFAGVLAGVLSEAEELTISFDAALQGATVEELEDSLDAQEEDADRHAEEISEEVAQVLSTLDAGDIEEAHEHLAEASVLIESAKQAELEGDLQKALRFYTDANGRLGELTILLEADAELGVDVLDEERN